MLLHEGLAHGQYAPVDHPRLREFAVDLTRDPLALGSPRPLSFADDYIDPVSHLRPSRHFTPDRYAGKWLAGFAQVGNTNLVVIVQTRYEDAVALDRQLMTRLAAWAGVALLWGTALLLIVVWLSRVFAKRSPDA